MFKKIISAISATLELKEAEARRGITAIEAAAINGWDDKLSYVTGSHESKDSIIDMAVLLAQLGVSKSDDLEEMVVMWRRLTMRGISIENIDQLTRLVGQFSRLMVR